MGINPDGYYDYAEHVELDDDGECLGAYVAAFCTEQCANKFHGRKTSIAL